MKSVTTLFFSLFLALASTANCLADAVSSDSLEEKSFILVFDKTTPA